MLLVLQDAALSATFSPSGQHFCSTGADGKVRHSYSRYSISLKLFPIGAKLKPNVLAGV